MRRGRRRSCQLLTLGDVTLLHCLRLLLVLGLHLRHRLRVALLLSGRRVV